MSLPIFALDQWFSRAEGRYELSLSHSGCEPIAAEEFIDQEFLQSVLRQPLGYGAFAGLSSLLETIAEQYEVARSDQIITFHGPSEAIYTFMRAVLAPGDRVVAASPVFQPLHAIARTIGCDVVNWEAADSDRCRFDVSDLERLCDESTKLITVNFPHNPSGATIPSEQLQQIVKIARKNDAYLLNDEAFRLLEYSPAERLPAVCDLYEKGISLTGLSKPYGLGGLRIGWMATQDREIIESVKQYRFYTSEMTNTPCQWFAQAAIGQTERIVSKNVAMIQRNLQRLKEFVDEHNALLQLFAPKAGTMALVEQRTSLTSTQLCESVLDEQQLFLIPGKLVGMSDRLLRIGLGIQNFDAGLDRFSEFLVKISREGPEQV